MKLLWIWPWWLVMIVLVVGLMLCWAGWRDSRHRPWSQRRGSGEHEHMSVGGRGSLNRHGGLNGCDWRWVRRGLMVAVVALMGAAPGIRTDVAEIGTNAEVYFVVDATGSMGAEDYAPGGSAGSGTAGGGGEGSDGEGAGGSGGAGEDQVAGRQRVDGVRADLTALAREYPGARFSIIRFDSRATTQLPLTSDLRAVESWAETFKLESSYTSGGSTINRPVEELTTTLRRSAEEKPGNVRILYVLSDGESTDPYAESGPRFAEAGAYVSGGAVLGYGSEMGGKMPVQGGYSGDGYIIDPLTGQPAISRINEAVLKEVAEQLGVPYAHRVGAGGSGSPGNGGSSSDEGSGAVNPKIGEGLLVGGIEELLEQGSNTRSVYNVQIWPLGMALVGLMMWEIYATTPRLRGALELRRATRDSASGRLAGTRGGF